MQIVDEDQHRAMSFIAAANRGGNRPTSREVHEWLSHPRPKPGRKGPLIKRGKPAKYRTVGGLPGIMSPYLGSQTAMLAEMMKAATVNIPRIQLPAVLPNLLGVRELIEEATPDEYGPDIPAESFVGHLVRLGWVDRDEQGNLGLTPLGRALVRDADTTENEADSYDVVVLDANDDLSYPMLIQRLADAGDALLIDPFLRVDQLLVVKAYTTISRVLVSAKLNQEDRVAMAVLVTSGSDHPLELRAAGKGILHDRMVIGDDSAFTIGTSMNTVGRQYPTILTPLPDVAADAMRVHAEQWWDCADVLAAYPPSREPADREP